MKITFEAHDCWKCSGTGYINAFSHVMGGVCFSCGGAKTKLTSKGLRARKAYDSAMKVPTDELVAGDIIMVDGKRREIASIGSDAAVRTMVDGEWVLLHKEIILTTGTKTIVLKGGTIARGICPANYELIRTTLSKLSGATIIE